MVKVWRPEVANANEKEQRTSTGNQFPLNGMLAFEISTKFWILKKLWVSRLPH